MLRSRGLDVPLVPDVGGVYVVLKPAKTPGNHIKELEIWFTNDAGEDEMCDAPQMLVYAKDNNWHIWVSNHVGGRGPGDFTKIFSTEDDLASAVLEYYFGSSAEFEALRQDREGKA